MPTYEYRCEHCDANFDVVQSFHDDPLQSCPTCGSPVRKVFGNVGIVFKGSGFYKTDSREKKARAGAEKSDGASTGAPESGDKAAASAGEKAAPSTGNGSGSTERPHPGRRALVRQGAGSRFQGVEGQRGLTAPPGRGPRHRRPTTDEGRASTRSVVRSSLCARQSS